MTKLKDEAFFPKDRPGYWLDKLEEITPNIHVRFVQSGKEFKRLPPGRVFLPEWLQRVILELSVERGVKPEMIANKAFWEAMRYTPYFSIGA